MAAMRRRHRAAVRLRPDDLDVSSWPGEVLAAAVLVAGVLAQLTRARSPSLARRLEVGYGVAAVNDHVNVAQIGERRVRVACLSRDVTLFLLAFRSTWRRTGV